LLIVQIKVRILTLKASQNTARGIAPGKRIKIFKPEARFISTPGIESRV
jgi:hypothetical protein